MATGEDGLFALAFVDLNLPLPEMGISSLEDARFSQLVDALVHSGKRISVSDNYGDQLSTVDKKLERTVLFRCKDDCARLLGCGGFEDVVYNILSISFAVNFLVVGPVR